MLLLETEAIKKGLTLAAFVTERHEQSSIQVKDDILEKRLIKIEKQLDSLRNPTLHLDIDLNVPKIFFRILEQKNMVKSLDICLIYIERKRNFLLEDALDELSKCLDDYDAFPELVYAILSGQHCLTGMEMTNAYKNGFCGMRSALNDWTKDPLEPLNEAFINSVQSENLV